MFSASEHTRVPNLCPRVEVPRAQLPAGVFPLLVVACSLLCAGCCSCCSHPCNTRPASRLPQCQRPGASAGREVALLSHPEPLQGRFTPFLEEPSDQVVSQVGKSRPVRLRGTSALWSLQEILRLGVLLNSLPPSQRKRPVSPTVSLHGWSLCEHGIMSQWQGHPGPCRSWTGAQQRC